MNKCKKILIFCMIMSISIGGLFIKGYFDDEVYVLNDKDEISLDNKEDNLENLEAKDSKNDDDLEEDKIDKEISKKKITVYISGEIKNPGVVTLDSDKRLSDAVNILGGVTEKADMNEINLAMKLEDEMHCIIPKKGSKKSDSISNEDSGDKVVESSNNSDKININQAGLGELDEIPGVGEATANKILSYRNENGSFKNIEEIKNVSGIGEKKFENMKDYICVN